ncbi:hypothetical protein [Dysgonomonas sp. GY617]|uniref:hypothetical protein n=1 Tax=Dysgonomonas sp. GY617 TaxID=2780420 RepID=UPI001883F252|nr:hypothetical protein [Dysgonomonas sp. GY617]MBF0575456.1 hypothetical protein [Dysgonomonas sp. GY617]
MQKLKKINLNLEKDVIAFLNEDSMSEMKEGGWTSGCTDGCSPAQSWTNCTNAGCTNIPSWLLNWGITIVSVFILFILIGANIIKYPDVISVPVKLTGRIPSLEVVAKTNGKSAHKEYKLQGMIGTIPIYMNIEDYPEDNSNNDRRAMGRYFYQSSLKDIVLWGNRQNNTYNLVVESGFDKVTETFTLTRKGNNFEGKWVNSKGKALPVILTPIDTDNIQNPYIGISCVEKLREKDSYDYVRSSFVKLKRDSVSQIEDKSIIWFSEEHCDAPFFRLGNGFNKNQVTTVNPLLDEIHFENILNQLSCSFNWDYSDGTGIEYTTTIGYQDNNLIGFKVFSAWFCGGAHPDFGGIGYLLDLNNGKSYDLKDIYNIDATIIYDLVNEQENFQNPISDDYCDYTRLECWQNPRWAISKKGVYFTPDFGTVTRACEEPFFVPFSKLRPYMKQDFPYNLSIIPYRL